LKRIRVLLEHEHFTTLLSEWNSFLSFDFKFGVPKRDVAKSDNNLKRLRALRQD